MSLKHDKIMEQPEEKKFLSPEERIEQLETAMELLQGAYKQSLQRAENSMVECGEWEDLAHGLYKALIAQACDLEDQMPVRERLKIASDYIQKVSK